MAHPVRHRGKWRVRWIDAKGKRQSATFDTCREAEFQLRQREHEAEAIRRGLQPGPIADRSMNELFDYWIKNRAPHKRSGDDDVSIIKQFRDPFGKLTLRAFVEGHIPLVDGYINSKPHLEKQTLRNHLTLLNTMLTLAGPGDDGLHWIDRHLKLKKPKVRLFSKAYRWLRSRDEITRFLEATKVEGEIVHLLYACAAYTGMRQGELAALAWSDIDFERRLISVWKSHDGATKGDDVHYVPIFDALLPLLQRWRLRNPLELVFPNRAGHRFGPCSRMYREVLHRVLRRAGLPDVMRRRKLRPYITFHDLRHTFASHWVLGGGDIYKLQLMLGHQSIELTQRYAHLRPDAFAGDHGRFGGPDTSAPTSNAARETMSRDPRRPEERFRSVETNPELDDVPPASDRVLH